ncbi:hypothetical protein ACWJKU_02955 [Methylocaldum sp. MU1018]
MTFVVIGRRLTLGGRHPILIGSGLVFFLRDKIRGGCHVRKIDERLKAGDQNEGAEQADDDDQADTFLGNGLRGSGGFPWSHCFLKEADRSVRKRKQSPNFTGGFSGLQTEGS